MYADELSVFLPPRQLSMWYFVNGNSVSSKNLGQPIQSIQSFILSQSLASSLYALRMRLTIAVASGHRGGLFGIPAATSFWKVGLLLALE